MEHTDIREQHLLINFEDPLLRAQAGKRFANHIIDTIFFYLIMFGIGILLAIISPASLENLDNEGGFNLIEQVLGLLLYVLFMFAQEAIFKGKSLGKLITGTCAVNLDGSTINAHTAMLRALSRAVPFDAFSALGTPCNPWHDKWSNTMVIEQKTPGAAFIL
ncbi:MAG: RDD family protein [Chitinophagaceae bacterium]|nr:RDD family protein [Chitinophagaceae bacterium]